MMTKVLKNVINNILVLLILLIVNNTVSAEELYIQESYKYTLNENEVIKDAEDKAINLVLRKVIVSIGSRIKSYTIVIDKVLKEDKIQRFSSAVVKIQKKTIEPELNSNGKLFINVNIEAIINTDDINKWEKLDNKTKNNTHDNSNDIIVMNPGKEMADKDNFSDDFKEFKKKITYSFLDGTFTQLVKENIDKADKFADDLMDANYSLGCLAKGDVYYMKNNIDLAKKYWLQSAYDENNMVALNRLICLHFNNRNFETAKKYMKLGKDRVAYTDNWYKEGGMEIFDNENRTFDIREYILSGKEIPS